MPAKLESGKSKRKLIIEPRNTTAQLEAYTGRNVSKDAGSDSHDGGFSSRRKTPSAEHKKFQLTNSSMGSNLLIGIVPDSERSNAIAE